MARVAQLPYSEGESPEVSISLGVDGNEEKENERRT
jgi:hypothetical protein